MLLIADPKVLAVPIIENHDPMVDVRKHPDILCDAIYRVECLNLEHDKHAFVRQQVLDKLIHAQSLLPNSWRIKLIEGHRSLAIQQLLFDKVYAQRKEEQPELDHQALFLKTIETVSPIINLDNSQNVPPHAVGGAVDIKLFDEEGQELDCGKFPEEDLHQDPECFKTQSTLATKTQQQHRDILCQAMEQVGFVNYPYEWWHFSYGDRYWAFLKRQAHAVYSLISL